MTSFMLYKLFYINSFFVVCTNESITSATGNRRNTIFSFIKRKLVNRINGNYEKIKYIEEIHKEELGNVKILKETVSHLLTIYSFLSILFVTSKEYINFRFFSPGIIELLNLFLCSVSTFTDVCNSKYNHPKKYLECNCPILKKIDIVEMKRKCKSLSIKEKYLRINKKQSFQMILVSFLDKINETQELIAEINKNLSKIYSP